MNDLKLNLRKKDSLFVPMQTKLDEFKLETTLLLDNLKIKSISHKEGNGKIFFKLFNRDITIKFINNFTYGLIVFSILGKDKERMRNLYKEVAVLNSDVRGNILYKESKFPQLFKELFYGVLQDIIEGSCSDGKEKKHSSGMFSP